MNQKTLNKEITIQNILNKCNNNSNISIDINKFNQRVKEDNSEEFIIDAAIFCDTEIVYL